MSGARRFLVGVAPTTGYVPTSGRADVPLGYAPGAFDGARTEGAKLVVQGQWPEQVPAERVRVFTIPGAVAFAVDVDALPPVARWWIETGQVRGADFVESLGASRRVSNLTHRQIPDRIVVDKVDAVLAAVASTAPRHAGSWLAIVDESDATPERLAELHLSREVDVQEKGARVG